MLALSISEIHAEPLFGSIEQDQYVEFRGTPGETIPNGTYFVVVDGDFLDEGNIHTVFDLSGVTIGSNGYLVLLEGGSNYDTDSGATVLKSTSAGFSGLPNGMFRNDSTITDHIDFIIGANTYMLITAPTAPPNVDNDDTDIVDPSDVDANNDGTLDGIATTWTVLDSVGVLNTGLASYVYAPIAFRWFGVGISPPGATVVEMDHRISYVARIGESTGFAAEDWVAGTTTERTNSSFQFRLERGVFGSPEPRVYAGRDLDHIGSRNFSGAISGTVFADEDGDGNQSPTESGMGSVTVFADVISNESVGEFTVHVEPDDFLEDSDMSNVIPNATLTIAGSDNEMQSFFVRPAVVFFPQWASTGSQVFAVERVDFFPSNARLRIDFYRPVRAVSIDAIGITDLADVYGRLEAFNSAGDSLGFVRSQALGDGQVDRLTISRANADISWAVAYSDDTFLSSSPFGKLDHLSFIQPEPSTTTNATGDYTLDLLPASTYTVGQIVPANRKQSFPVTPPGTHTRTINGKERGPDADFGNRGNLPPSISDQTLSVSENSSTGAVVGTVVATDIDTEQAITFSITGGTGEDLFAINAANGRLTVASGAALDFEDTTSWTVVVRVVDNYVPPADRSATITVNVNDVNEPPTIPDHSFTISENAANTTAVGTVTASDPDANAAGEVRFTIVDGNIGGAFQIDPVTGHLTVANAAALDFEATPHFELLVRAADQGSPVKTTSNTVRIDLQNQNEAPAIITTSLDVPENRPNGSVIGDIAINDPDAGELFTFLVHSGNEANAFTVNITNGQITVRDSALLNFEMQTLFTLEVEVLDDGNPALSDQAFVEIRIGDVNETPEVEPSSFAIDENSAAGVVVGRITASDPDNGQHVTYAIVDGTGRDGFAIDGSSGDITVADNAGLNFEALSELDLLVEVTDDGSPPESGSATITIHLNNVNETPSIDPQSFSVAENVAVGAVVGTVAAFDQDAGDALTYEIVGGGGAPSFEINSTSGELKVRDSAALDREAAATLTMDVRVSDQSGRNATSPVTVQLRDQNEFVPSIATSSLSIIENSVAGAHVGNVLVNDLDATHSFSFLLTSGNLDDAFTIDPDTGAITVRTTEALNHEARPSYELTVEVVDSVEPSRQTSAVVTIGITDANEFAPAFNDHAITIDENLILDAVVGTLTATDEDSSQSLQFSITGGNTNAAFKIDTDTGELRVNNPAELDFEVSPIFTLNVQVSDTGEPADSDSAIVTIHLNDVNEFSPVIAPQTFTLEELATFSTSVGTVVATDLDALQTLQFAIVDGNLGNAFSIDAVTGALRVIRTIVLDFETTPTFLLAISATDNGQPTRTGTGAVTVNLTDLNEFPPTVEPGSFSVQENSAVGAVVGVVSASDMDAEQALTFTITGGNTGNAFTVDSVTGEIRVHENSLLDFEGGSAWTLTVTATDSGQPALTSNGTVTISLTDVNEFDPAVGDASFTLAENPVAGVVIGSLSAGDADSSQSLTFAVVTGSPENAVTIDAANGEIRVQDPAVFDFEVRQMITLTVLVSDNGEPERTDTANVTIHLQDVNESAPQLEQTTFHVDENITGGPTVTDLVVNDADLLQTHTFEILSGNTDDVFRIDAATGVIKLRPEASLDHEAISTFHLAVQVTDNGVPPRSATETVTIVVDNVNELPSAKAGGPYPMDAGTALQLDASNSTDPDTDDSLQFKWDFNLDGTFDVTTSEAMITVAWSTLADLGLHPGTHEIQLEVVDDAGRSSLASANVVISDTFMITPADSGQKDLTLSLSGEKVEVHSGTNLLNAVSFSDIENVKVFGSNEDNSLTVDYRSGNPIPTGGLEFDGGGGHDTFVIGGSNVHLNLTDPTGPHFTNIEALNIVGNSPNTLTLDVAAVLDVTDDGNTLSVLSDEDDTVHLGSGWRINGTAVEQGVFVRILHQGSAIVHLAGPWDWNNPLLAFDVNANGTVEPQDVLVLINELNSPRFSQADRRLTAASGLATFPNFYYDAKADGLVVPLDALPIINFLNNRTSAAEGEGSDLAWNQVFEDFEFGPGPFIASATNGSELRTNDHRDSAAMSRPEPDRICEQPGHTPEVLPSTEVLPQRWHRRSDRADYDLVAALNLIFADLGCSDEL